MGYNDPAEKALIRLEVRRFASRCDGNQGLLQRADSLREVARLASLSIPFRVADEYEARDALRRLVQTAEDRAKEVITDQIAAMLRAEEGQQRSLKNRMTDDWSNLTGVLGHLRRWAALKLAAADQTGCDTGL